MTSTFEPYNRVKTRFPQIPTDQPTCVEDLHDLQKQQWIDFSKSVLDVLERRNKISIIQIITIVILIIVIVVLLAFIGYFIIKNLRK